MIRHFESNLMTIVVGILPSLTAHKALMGRGKVIKASESYFRNKGHEEASVLMRNRYEISTNNGLAVEDIARYEVGGAFAILVNTAPAVFWALFLTYSHPGLLADLRRELDPIMTRTIGVKGLLPSLDITSLQTNCPLLTSTFQDVLRYPSRGTSIRQVMENSVLDGQRLLKKDCTIQMPSRMIHQDPSLWGTDVGESNPRRLMKDEPQKTPNGKSLNAAAFRAFGGRTTICPGRHCATT